MTTGRINQVTIVTPKGLAEPLSRGEGREISLPAFAPLSLRPRRRASDAGRARCSPHGAWPMGAPRWLPLSPSRFPRALSAAHDLLSPSRGGRVPPKRPKGRPLAREFSYSAFLCGWVSPVALAFRLGYQPAVHRAHPTALGDFSPSPLAGHPTDEKPPWRSRSQGKWSLL